MIQRALEWNPPGDPLVLNPTAPEQRLPGLQKKCWVVLERLLRGPATNVELHELIGGTRNAAPRVGDLRPHLRRGAGLSAWDKASDPIPCEHQESTGLAVYAIAPWALDAARQLLSSRPNRTP